MTDTFTYRKFKEGVQNNEDIKDFILKYYKENGRTPSSRTISEELDLSMSAVQRHLRQLEDEGKIKFNGTGSHRTYELIGASK